MKKRELIADDFDFCSYDSFIYGSTAIGYRSCSYNLKDLIGLFPNNYEDYRRLTQSGEYQFASLRNFLKSYFNAQHSNFYVPVKIKQELLNTIYSYHEDFEFYESRLLEENSNKNKKLESKVDNWFNALSLNEKQRLMDSYVSK